MNHEINDPVLISTECGFGFGVIDAIVTSVQRTGTTVKLHVITYDNGGGLLSYHYDEASISELERPCSYDFTAMKKAFVAHPGYKWALAESERLKNPPAKEAIPATLPTVVPAQAPNESIF